CAGPVPPRSMPPPWAGPGAGPGGILPAVVSLDARDRGGPVPLLQWLIYPGTDMAMDTASIARHAEQLPLTKKAMQWFVAHYLRQPSDARDWPPSPPPPPRFPRLPPAPPPTPP